MAILLSAIAVAHAVGPPLEELANKYGTDKAVGDHGYVQLYGMLLDHMRENVLNFTEIGTNEGNSMLLWHEYFPNAQTWHLDIRLHPQARSRVRYLPRAHLLQANSTQRSAPTKLHLAEESMDVVLDDGDHTWHANEATLLTFW